MQVIIAFGEKKGNLGNHCSSKVYLTSDVGLLCPKAPFRSATQASLGFFIGLIFHLCLSVYLMAAGKHFGLNAPAD